MRLAFTADLHWGIYRSGDEATGLLVEHLRTEPPDVHFDQALYHGDAEDALELLRAVPATVGSVLLIGHNPTVSMLSSLLDRGTDRDSDGLRTSGIAVHTQDGAWTDLVPGGAPVRASYTGRAGG